MRPAPPLARPVPRLLAPALLVLPLAGCGGSNTPAGNSLSASSFHETVLHSFPASPDYADSPEGGYSSDGSYPQGTPVLDAGNTLYATTSGGGDYGWGALIALKPDGSEHLALSFPPPADYYSSRDSSDMSPPAAFSYNTDFGLVIDNGGNVYGATNYGGMTGCARFASIFPFGCGMVYKLAAGGSATTLWTMQAGLDSHGPGDRLALDSSGTLYGTAGGGAFGAGVLYEIPAGQPEIILWSFGETPADGAYPSGVTVDAFGDLYGTTGGGGSYGLGAVFRFSAAGGEQVLHAFRGAPGDGAGPYGSVVSDDAGNRYGVTLAGGAHGHGTVYELTAAGQEIILWSFAGAPADGAAPNPGLLIDPQGDVAGTTAAGGAHDKGTAFAIPAGGNERLLWSFGGSGDGSGPQGGLAADKLGNLYGSTRFGGSDGGGVVYRLTPAN